MARTLGASDPVLLLPGADPQGFLRRVFDSKTGLLVGGVLDLRDGSQRPLRYHGSADHVGEGKDLILDLRRETEQAHDLGHSGPRDPFSTGDLGLIRDVTGVYLFLVALDREPHDRPPAHIKPGPPLATICDHRPPAPATATA